MVQFYVGKNKQNKPPTRVYMYEEGCKKGLLLLFISGGKMLWFYTFLYTIQCEQHLFLMIPASVSSISPGWLLEMHILRPHHRPTGSESKL